MLITYLTTGASEHGQELENEGRIVQIGKTGILVSYSLKTNG